MRCSLAFGALLLCAANLPLAAQYPSGPGDTNPSPGCLPGYPCPTGGGGLQLPGRGKKKKQEDTPLLTLNGMLRQLDDKRVIVEAEDTRIIDLKRLPGTKFLKDGNPLKPGILTPGDHLFIEYRQDDEGFMTAVNVTLQKAGTIAERERASVPVEVIEPVSQSQKDDERPVQRRRDSPKDSKRADAPTQEPPPSTAPQAPSTAAPSAVAEPPVTPPDAGIDLNHIPTKTNSGPIDDAESGPPKLTRGKPKATKASDAHDTDQVAANSAPPAAPSPHPSTPSPEPPSFEEAPPPVDKRIQKAMEAAGSFTETLPDYVCQEQMARFASDSPKVNWVPQDVVSMEVIYEKGKERYRNLAINGKLAKTQKMEELGGSWSTGEFGTVLVDIFSPYTAADFRYRHTSKSGGRDAYLYDFDVDHEHSHWRIGVASQTVMPAYKGSIWIDRETFRVLRVEMQALHMPAEFPFDKIEMATDYEFTRLSEHQFLLPVHSENLMCQRGTSVCSHNVIDFRNYHKYTGEATIEFGK